MTPELWNRLKPLFEAVVERPTADREAFIATIDAEDELRRELQKLVSDFEASGTTLDAIAANLQALIPGARAALQPNDVLLGRFRIVRWIGSGGMGDVYEAFDLELGEPVALKTIRPSIAGNPEVLARFKREVQIARHLTAPNLCRIHEFFMGAENRSGSPHVFITMELLNGITLAEEIRRNGPVSWLRAREIAKQICAALELMHEAGIIHRDIKTRNIMLAMQNSAEHPVLMDFGLAREVASSPSDSPTVTSVPGALVGTPANMAPEQFTGGALSAATDIYAMGIVLYEMVTGRAPFAANEAVQAAILRSKPPALVSRLGRGVPLSLNYVIAKCLQFDPKNRYQSAKELAHDLQRLSTPFGMFATRVSSSSRRWISVVLGVMVLVAGMGWWFLSARAPAPPDPRAVPWYEGGLAALRDGSYLQAAREFEQALKLDDRFVAAHARLAEAWAELDYTGDAEHQMLIALKESKARALTPLDRRYLEATQSTLANDFAGAVRQREAILDLLPEEQKGYGYVDLGRSHEKNNDIAAAVTSYETAAKLRPDNPAAFVRLGILRSRQQDSEAAEAAFGQAENLYRLKQNVEGLAEVYFARARWANQRGDSTQAEMWLERCAQIARQIPSVQLEIRALTQLSNVEYDSNRDDKSIEDAKKAIQLARENNLEYWVADGLIRQANALLDKRDFAQAEALTQEALKLAQQHEFRHLTANAQLTLASIRDQQGRRDEQTQFARAALRYYARSGYRRQAADSEDLLVRAQIALGELEGAYQSATTLVEDSEKLGSSAQLQAAEMTLGNVLMRMQRYPEALAHFQRALQLSQVTNQDVPYQLLHCADALANIGNYPQAEVMLNKITGQWVNSDLASEIARVRASMRLSQRRFSEAGAIASSALRRFNDMSSDERLSLGYVVTIAALGTGHRPEAQQESQKLADLAHGENNAQFTARSYYLQAIVGLQAGSPSFAREKAEAAQTYFATKQQFESQWVNFVCLAKVDIALGDKAKAAQNATKALNALQILQQSWDTASREHYGSRPDTRFAVAEMNSLISHR